MIYNRVKKVGVILLMSAALVACAQKPWPKTCSQAATKRLDHWIDQAGGQFVQIGDYVTIDLPTHYLFDGNSKNLRYYGNQLLNRVAQQLACYRTESLRVTAYTGVFPLNAANLSLSRQRAKLVADHLLNHDVSRLIYEKSKVAVKSCPKCRYNRIVIETKRMAP